MIDWKFANTDVTVENIDINQFFGFVYLIEFEDGKKYIGRKNFFTQRKRRFGKKEIAALKDKRLKRYEIVKKESNWKTYISSNKDVVRRIVAGDKFKKYILDFARTKKHLSYLEEAQLIRKSVLFDESYYNDNIAGKFYTKDVLEWEQIKR